MRFKRTAVAPQGRNKYGDYLSSSNVTKKVIKSSYYGDASNNEIDGGGTGSGRTGDTEDDGNWILDLSLKAYDFDGSMLPTTTSTKTIDVIGYRKRSRADTFIGDISTTATSETYSISGIPESGMTISVDDNGTPQTKINITISSGISETEGVLQIPVSLYLKSIPGEPLDDDISAWNSSSADCVTETFEFSWRVVNFSNSVYTLDLTNESASINCDTEGNILPDAVRPTCQAIVYLGSSALTSGVTFTMTSPQAQNLQGVSINTTTGVLTFGSNFAFDGTAIEITISAQHAGNNAGTAIMNVAKAYPGTDGKPATSYWLVLSSNSVKITQNNEVIPSSITATAMMQVGSDAPTAATGCSIFYGYNTQSPSTSYPSSGVTIDASKEYLSFVLKKGSAIVDGVETVPIIIDGKNGQSGQTPYLLDLTNESAGINCDSDGNILTNAARPTCKAILYHGTDIVAGAVYSISEYSLPTSGVSIDGSTGVLTFNPGNDTTPFNFTGGTALEITIQAKVGGVLYGTTIMTISKQIAGSDGGPGDDAKTYWLVLSADAVKVTTAGTFTPATITVTAYKQVGENNPAISSDGTIKWGYDTTSPSTTYSNPIPTSGGTNYITIQYVVNNVVRCNLTVPILRDGKDGLPGGQGRQGAAVRGPVNWYTAMEESGRRWCNGSGATGTQDAQWIDIILKDGTYYFCNTSYTEAGQSWASVSSKWTSAGEQFDFIATNLLLANNAAINFLTGNEIYLRDNNNNITAGAAGGNGISFWAGSETPSSAPFRVNYDGSIYASNGVFSGYIRVPYVNYTALTTTTTTLNGTTISGKDAGENAYIMKVGGSTSDKLILPEPTESLAGMTYRIIVGSYMELYFKGANNNAKCFDLAQTSWNIKKIIARYGYIELTCMLAAYGTRGGTAWSWAITNFNGILELYYVSSGQILFDKAVTPIYGMSLVTGDTYTVKYINADNPLPSDANKSSDTIYVSRT